MPAAVEIVNKVIILIFSNNIFINLIENIISRFLLCLLRRTCTSLLLWRSIPRWFDFILKNMCFKVNANINCRSLVCLLRINWTTLLLWKSTQRWLFRFLYKENHLIIWFWFSKIFLYLIKRITNFRTLMCLWRRVLSTLLLWLSTPRYLMIFSIGILIKAQFLGHRYSC